MRSLLLGLVLLLPSGAFAQQAPEWTLLPDSPLHPSRHEDVFFFDPDHGWVVGGVGMYRTTDGGAVWEMIADVEGLPRSAGFTSTEKGWIGILFASEQLYETLDGGLTLADISNRIQPAIGGGICGLWVVNEQVAYGVGQFSGPAYLTKTTDGGQTWESTDMMPYVSTLVDVYFFDEDHGLAVGGVDNGGGTLAARVVGTDDGGDTWTVRHTAGSIGYSWGWKISFPTSQDGFVSIEYNSQPTDGYLLKTTDGGETWTEVLVPGGGSMQGTGFLTPDIGWTSGRDTTSVTTNGGQTWQQIDLDPHINRFRFFGDSLGYAVGSRVYILDMRPVSNENDVPTAHTYLESVTPNPASGPVSIAYRLERPGPATIHIYDMLGRTIVELDEGVKSAGRHVVVWEAPNESHSHASGIYMVQLLTEAGAWTKVITLVRR